MKGDYGSIRLVIDMSELPSNFNSLDWMAMLKVNLKHVISKTYHISGDQVEIESIRFVVNQTMAGGTASQLPSPSEEHMLMYIDINILPLSANPENVTISKNVF